MTIDQFHAQLRAEGKWDDYLARREERGDAFRRSTEECAQAEAPLVQALAEAGRSVKSVWDLVNSATRHYPELVPILLDHLQRPYPDSIRDGIARALTVPEARPHWMALVRLYRRERGPRTRDGLAVAIAGVATDDVIGDVIALAADRCLGTSRALLLLALERSHDPRANQALSDLSMDPDLRTEVKAIVGRKRRDR